MDEDVDPEDNARGNSGAPEATELLRRLLRAGLSRWEPDPVAALEAVGMAGPTWTTPTIEHPEPEPKSGEVLRMVPRGPEEQE